jgi:mitogen-activated protein kinase kinase kinase 7
MTVAQGSVSWMAPEVFQGHNYTEKCDIFSWAVTFWQILSRNLPYFNLDSPAQSEQLSSNSHSDSAIVSAAGGGGGAASFRIMWAVHSGERPQLLKHCPLVLEQLLKSCWDEHPNLRPSIDQVIAQIDPLFRIMFKHSCLPLQLPPESSSHGQSDVCLTYTPNSRLILSILLQTLTVPTRTVRRKAALKCPIRL